MNTTKIENKKREYFISMRFECMNCGNILPVSTYYDIKSHVSPCDCGNERFFKFLTADINKLFPDPARKK